MIDLLARLSRAIMIIYLGYIMIALIVLSFLLLQGCAQNSATEEECQKYGCIVFIPAQPSSVIVPPINI